MSENYSDPIQVIRRQKPANLVARLLSAPVYEEGEQERAHAASLLHTILLSLLASTLLGYLALINYPRPFAAGGAITLVLVIVVTAYILLKIRREKLSGLVLATGLWVGLTILGMLSEGVANSTTYGYILVVTIAGLTLGGRAGLIYAGLCGLAGFGILLSHKIGLLPRGVIAFEPLSFVILMTIILAATAVMIQLATNRLNDANRRAFENERAQVKANQELQAARSMLEELVNARTLELQNRSKYLQATIEVSRTAASMLETEQLMTNVVDLIRTQFDLYYVGLFLLDPSGDWAVLRAGTGAAGQAMLARGHRIRYGTGMVGWCIANAQPRIATDIGTDSVRLATPELPETRSEAAFPLRARGRVIGAMTIQSVRPTAFGETEISTFQTLADQIAVALENARLYSESQKALQEAQKASRQLTGEAWQSFLSRGGINLQFRYDHGQILSMPDANNAVESSTVIQKRTDKLGSEEALHLPITVRGQQIGTVRFIKDQSEADWSAEEISLLSTVVDQLGIALESARLYEETRRRAERERLTSEIVTKMRASNDPQTIIQTAVLELRKALQVDRAQLLVKTASDREIDRSNLPETGEDQPAAGERS